MRTGSNTRAVPHDFGAVSVPGRERNSFFWRVNRKHTMDAGLLVPCYRQRVIPGDRFELSPRFFIRFASALLKPVMDNATCYVYYFKVPDRIVYPKIKQFFGEVGVGDFVDDAYAIGNGYTNSSLDTAYNIGGTDMPDDSYSQNFLDIFTNPSYGLPFVKISEDAEGSDYVAPTTGSKPSPGQPAPFKLRSLYDYFALPYCVSGSGYAVCAIPLLGYNSIYNHYFRDENIVSPAPSPFEAGTNLSEVDSNSLPAQSFSENCHIYEDATAFSKGNYLRMDLFKVMPVSKYNDYFTRMLPFQQKGTPIGIGLSGTLPVYGSGYQAILSRSLTPRYSGDLLYPGFHWTNAAVGADADGTGTTVFTQNGSSDITNWIMNKRIGQSLKPPGTDPYSRVFGVPEYGNPSANSNSTAYGFYPLVSERGVLSGFDADGKYKHWNSISDHSEFTRYNQPFGRALLDGVQSLDIRQVRMGFQLERILELLARCGSRYDEFIKAMYNVNSSDARIQIPEFCGGFKFLINVNPVVQSSSTVGQVTPLGDLGAYGVGSKIGNRIRIYSEEFGTIIGVMCIRTNNSYQQMLHPDWVTTKVSDFYLPTLAHLSEEPIKNRTLCTTGIFEYDNATLGFLPRYEHYRTGFNEICCEFRSNALNSEGKVSSLDIWHYGQFFDTSNPGSSSDNYPGLPHLNAQFLKQPREVISRALSIQDEDLAPQFLCDITHDVFSVRCVSKYGEPGYVDHFQEALWDFGVQLKKA